MTVTLNEQRDGVEIVVESGDERASCTVVGLSKAEVDSRVEDFIAAHGLREELTE